MTPEERQAAIDEALKKRNAAGATGQSKTGAKDRAAAAQEAAKRKAKAKKGDPGYGR